MSKAKMGLEEQLIERAVEKRRKKLQKAKARAGVILQKAEDEVERIKRDAEQQVLNIVGSELRAVRDRIVGQAELDGKKTLMNARKNLLDSIFDKASKRLEEVARGETEIDYQKVLRNLILEAVKAIGGDEFVVRANEADLTYLRENMEDIDFGVTEIDLRLADNSLDIKGGVVVENPQGTKIYRNTLNGRLNKVRQNMEAEVAKKLGVI